MVDQTNKITAVRGMDDVLPESSPAWQYLESTIRQLMANYAYSEVRMPVLENTLLFKRSIGEVTDIVEKEMFTFPENKGESLSMRPEGTAGCVRMCIEHSLLRNQQPHKLWYMGQMFRYERPQKGRYRQFSQFGIEAFNYSGPDIDAEQLALCARLWAQLEIDSMLSLEINSLGDLHSRSIYRQKLVEYFSANQSILDEDSKRRLTTNPLRILDSKNPEMQSLIAQAPILTDYLDQESQQHFLGLQRHLTELGIKFRVNPRLVRGLDYYNRTVYEWVTDKLGAQSAVCAGGRYDGLVEMLGGPASPGVGFAMGLERVLLLLEMSQQQFTQRLDGYLICVGPKAEAAALSLAENIRDRLPRFSLAVHLGGGSFNNQFKKADKSGAHVALIIGDEELANNTVGIKHLREQIPQQTIAIDSISTVLGDL